MMSIEIISAILLLPVYLVCRWPYFRLPIGPDTGYYVSNATIVNRKFSFRKGWNARYAMCSKFFPEAFCSLTYVWFGHKNYKWSWRLLFSIYNFGTALGVGATVHFVTQGAPFAFLAGVAAYSLVSSESDYGVYYESAEQFEVFFQAWGTFFLLRGLQPGQSEFLGLGAGLWLLDVFFVKLTALAAAAPLLIGAIVFHPPAWKYILPLFLVFGTLYLLLFLTSNKNPLATVRSEAAHQSIYSRNGRMNISPLRGWFKQLEEKARQGAWIALRNPILPFFAIVGTFWASKNAQPIHALLLLLYVLGTWMKLMVSFLPIWWYTIPVLPIVGIFAGLGILEVSSAGAYGKIFVSACAVLWAYRYVYRAWRKKPKEFVNWVWKVHPEEGKIHWDLEAMLPDLERAIEKKSMFVYGYPSLCAMVGRSYDVNFLTGIRYMEEMNPRWQIELHERMSQGPPDYIFDMFGRFDADALKQNLGLLYEEAGHWIGDCSFGVYRLYKLVGRENTRVPNVNFRSHHFVPEGTL